MSTNALLPDVGKTCDETSVAVCSSFQCPDHTDSVKDADTVVCEDTGCTEDLCCEWEGEAPTGCLIISHCFPN